MPFRQYQTRVETVMAEQFFADRKPWPEGVYLRDWSGGQLPTVDTSRGPYPIDSGNWVVRAASGKLEVYGDLTFNENYEEKSGS